MSALFRVKTPLAAAFNLEKSTRRSLPFAHSAGGQAEVGPDGLELGAQQDARVTVEKAVCHIHLSYNDCSAEALSNDNSLQFWFRSGPICAHHPGCQTSMKMTLSWVHFCH